MPWSLIIATVSSGLFAGRVVRALPSPAGSVVMCSTSGRRRT